VVLKVTAGPISVLLGADMENHNDPHRGWAAAVSEGVQTPTPASLFKVAHHGSVNGDHDAVWTNLLTVKPLAAITPFNRLKESQKLPRPEDVARVKAKSSRVFLTADPRTGVGRRARNPAVIRSLRESGIVTRERPTELGMVRFRQNVGAWKVELFGAAAEV
jgi:beta-lactamase superfamily II metal-dependent hydrolase